MIRNFRERAWFISGFFKKYSLQILVSLGITIVIAFLGNFLISKIPTVKPTYKIGIVGQFSSNQLPQHIINSLNAGLVKLNDQYESVPALAEKWDIEDNGTTYIFYLKPNLKWHDGTPVKASDIKITIPNITIDTQDPNILRFHIPTRFSPFPTLLNIPLLNQKGETATENDIHLKQKSSGVISQITIDSPQKKLVYNLFSTPKQALVSFKLGQQDVLYGLPSNYSADTSSYGKITKQIDYNHVILLVFNQSDPNLKDKSIRQGIAYSLQDKIFGEAEALTTINPNSWAFNPLVKNYPFNPQKAHDLIKKPISLELATSPELLNIAEKIKAQLDSDILQINTKVITSTPDQFQLLLMNYSIPADPDQYRDWHSTQATNIGRGSDEKIDKLLEDGRITLETKARKQIYFDFQKTFSEELPALVLYYPSTINLARQESFFDILKESK